MVIPGAGAGSGWPERPAVAAALLLAAAAVALWPESGTGRPSPPGRLAGRGPAGRPGAGWTPILPSAVLTAVGAGALGWLFAGPLPAAAAAIAVGTAVRLVRDQRAERRRERAWSGLLAAVRMLGRELRSGAPPPAAAAATAAAIGGPAGELMSDLAAAGRLGLDRALPARSGPAGEVAEQLRAGLVLSARHGVPWAALVDAIAGDLADRVRAAGDRSAQVAGPRFSGYVLAALPAFGLLLGSGMGARPLQVLLGPAPGGLLLPAGVALACAGLLWSARIVRP
ncbi:type II secretion system F family protein [Nakamurella lactea]|uniref:type II secretion system F family protein n=1 Tax=Nakamurella lactea TaxID=459515 RepID=UPI0004129E88|nr:type II secretion system F family protein [Nakamurella lactea]